MSGPTLRTRPGKRRPASKTKGTPLKPGEELPTMVVIRADRATRFNLLNEIIKTCQQHNYRKFALKAMNRREGQ